jgi:hypothetical protein
VLLRSDRQRGPSLGAVGICPDQRLNAGAEAPRGSPEPRLCTLLEKWRAEKGTREPGFVWLREHVIPELEERLRERRRHLEMIDLR